MSLTGLWADNLTNLLLQLAGAPAGLPDPYVHLYTTMPLTDGTGGVTPSPTDGYVGPLFVAGGTFWIPSDSGTGEALSLEMDFGTPTADWGAIRGCALVESDGTLICTAVEFDSPMYTEVGTPFIFPENLLALTLT